HRRALGQCGSDRTSDARVEPPEGSARHPWACPAGARLADHSGPSIARDQGLCGPGGVTSLRPGARALPAGRGDPAALPGTAGIMELLFDPDGVTDDAGAGGAPPHFGPAYRRPRAPP